MGRSRNPLDRAAASRHSEQVSSSGPQPVSEAVGVITTAVVWGLVSLVMYVDYRGWCTAWGAKLVEQYQRPSRWRFLTTRSTRQLYSDPIRVRRLFRFSSGVGLIMSVAMLMLEAVAIATHGLQ